mgnify:CR=1 FL=1
MKKKTKILITVLSVILVIAALCGSAAYFTLLYRYKGKPATEVFDPDEPFDIDNIAALEKNETSDFVILNLTDVQMCDLEDIPHMSTIHAELTYLVNLVKPDLITLTGDQTWSNENLISLRSLISWLDGYKIPYAPVFGNHDHGNEYDSAVAGINYCCDLYEGGKYSLFKRGPNNLGSLGNYAVTITEGDNIVSALYFLESGYLPSITDKQKEWFSWTSEGIKSANGGEVPRGICFFHKPLPEYRDAYMGYLQGSAEASALGEVYVTYSLSGSLQNGFFDIAKRSGVTDIVCGHQHGNNFTIKYQGVNLTFAMKTGELGGFYADEDVNLNGATVLRIGENGITTEHISVGKGAFHIYD